MSTNTVRDELAVDLAVFVARAYELGYLTNMVNSGLSSKHRALYGDLVRSLNDGLYGGVSFIEALATHECRMLIWAVLNMPHKNLGLLAMKALTQRASVLGYGEHTVRMIEERVTNS